MKKIYFLIALGLAGAAMTSCDDLLDDNRDPQSQLKSDPSFWSSVNNVQAEVNSFYEQFTGYGNGSALGVFYAQTLSDDQANPVGKKSVTPWKNISIPSNSSDWNGPYTEIRRANLIIEGVASSTLTPEEKTAFTAVARLMRGYEYYLLVRAYGDVPLVTKALTVNDTEELFGPRKNRNEVMDYALEDISYAVDNIAVKSSHITFSADLAKAIKSEVCLYEASYAKYHLNDADRADKYYEEVVTAAGDLIKAYPIGSDYKALYNSFRTELTANPEVIFMKAYEKDILMHCTVDYTSSSTPVAGMTKDAFDTFLFKKDGKPLALTSETNKSDVGVPYVRIDKDGNPVKDEKTGAILYNYSIKDVLAVRDNRLSQMVDTAVYYTGLQYQRPNSMLMTSLTGYGVSKFDNPAMPEDFTTTIKNYTCAPLYWGALLACDYMEARAELGDLTDDDLDLTMNKLYARAGLPAMTVADLNAMADPANNMGVSSLLWEVRRCRRCELMFDKGIRYWDLVRWHQLEILDTTKYPNIALGANISASPVPAENVNGYIDASNGTERTFEARQYFYPIPSAQLQLNDKLEQQPLWK